MKHSNIRWKPYAVLALSLAATTGGTILMARATQARDRARFDNAIQAAEDRIRARLDAYVSTLIGAQGLFLASHSVDLSEFRAYVRSLEVRDRYPGIQGMGFSMRIPTDRVREVEQQIESEGQIDFYVWPGHERDEYHAIVYLEPLDRRNQAAIGYDMFTHGVRRRAMALARDTGEPAASGTVTLVQEIDQEKQPGFIIYVPVYRGSPASIEERREQLIGFVFSPFRVGDLFAWTFGSEEMPRVAFEVFDGATIDSANRIYRSDEWQADPQQSALRQILIAGGRPWTIDFRSTPYFDQTSSRPLAYVIPTIGLLASVILFWLTLSETRARAEAEAQRKNLHALFMEAPAAIAIVRGEELRYELSNPLNQEIVQGRDLIGRTAPEVVPELEAQGWVAKMQEVYRTGKPFVGKGVGVMVPSEDGMKQAYFDGIYQPMRGADGSIEGVVAYYYDVTDQVEARKKIESLAEDLQKAVRARDDFLSIAGHELNTPLAALRIQLDSFAARIDDPDLAARFEKLQRQVRRLEKLVSELLDVSRISSGRLTLEREEVELNALARDVIARFEEQAAKSNSPLLLHAEDGVIARCDRMRIDQVMTNLVSNAIKYGGGKPIDVCVERANGVARIEVKDHGIGIGPADRERIFGRFERAVSQRNFGGLGLGLWISRQIVEAHGGTISFASEPEVGTIFSVELPSSS